jgi:hypothetical protein
MSAVAGLLIQRGTAQRQYGRFGEDEFVAVPGIEPRSVLRGTFSLVTLLVQ